MLDLLGSSKILYAIISHSPITYINTQVYTLNSNINPNCIGQILLNTRVSNSSDTYSIWNKFGNGPPAGGGGVLMHGLVGFVDLFPAIPTLAIHPLGRGKKSHHSRSDQHKGNHARPQSLMCNYKASLVY